MMTADAAATTVRVAFDAPEGRGAGGGTAGRRRRERPGRPPIETLAVGSPGTVHLPLVTVTRGGRTAVHRAVDPNGTASLVSLLADGDIPVDGAAAVVDHGPDPDDFPVGDGPLSAGTRRTLRGAGWADPTAFESPAVLGVDALDAVAHLGVRGRGWGDARRDEPVVEGWREARNTDGDPVVVINGLDADPKVDGDRLLLASLTGRVVAVAVVAASAVGAEDVVVVVQAFVEVNPATADRLGIVDGERVRVESPRGAIEVRAEISDRPGDGVVFVPMHFADGAVNRLTGDHVDPTSGIPEYKLSSVRVERLNASEKNDERGPDGSAKQRRPDGGEETGSTAAIDD
ncbi:molybdopterin dinucleotide binding domain-containing protein [Halobaculum gomorrense]|uniref:Molydopterin dinucleotide binding domain-containing protein n=1 Tax=Halobaculum gomorrense TaxID=43928 RepID=A0A1M5SIB5_9EURY|nr:molybdopterin dinucleotide binding domain-containing protein [Halobaculum gomorrense]SHH38294.1 Molydopterin dinucleotide binding domain-containing protein [Halobaculum gomorrense]